MADLRHRRPPAADDVSETPLEREALLDPSGPAKAAVIADTGTTSPHLLAAAVVGFISAGLLTDGAFSAVLLLPNAWTLIEQGLFLGGGAWLGSFPTGILLWLACGERERPASLRTRRLLQTLALLWCALSLVVPFVLPASRGGLGPMSMALMLWVNMWKALDICAGTNPPSVLRHPLHLFAHLTFLIEYKTSRRMLPRSKSELAFFPRTASEQHQLASLGVRTASEHRHLSDVRERLEGDDEPERSEPREWVGRAVELGRTGLLFFLLASATELTPPSWILASPLGAFCLAWLGKYSHVWYVYAFLKLACEANGVALLLLGYRPQVVFRNPLTEATSPTDFWSRRWNMLVRGLFHRTVFTPLRHRGLPAWVSALAAFFVSGAFHEYAFAPASHGAAVGSLTVFFCIQAAVCTLELVACQAATRVPLLRTLDAMTPGWARVVLTSALLVPFSPLFMAPLLAFGTVDQMRAVMVRVRIGA